MKEIGQVFLMIVVLVSAVTVAGVTADEETGREFFTGTPPPEHEHFGGQWLEKFHNPAPGIEMGADIRLREIYAPRVDTLDKNPRGVNAFSSKWHFERYRMRMWSRFGIDDDMDINSRLVWEFYTWDDPDRKPSHVNFDEIIFDNLNLTWRNAFDMPMTMIIGRQDIFIGNGWLILEATPLDTSRTSFFDAVRLTYDWQEKDTTVDLIYINNTSAADKHWLKPFNDREFPLTEQDEQGFVLYASNKSFKDTQIDGYFIYKNDRKVKFNSNSGIPAVWSKDAELYTLGSRITGALDANWKYYVEAAAQSGKKNLNSQRAFGANSKLSYSFNDELNNNLHVGYEYLSGDDPGTTRDEAFDPLWGEWARFSEMMPYVYSRDGVIGETTNLHRLNFGHSFKPAPKWEIATGYHLLWADQNTAKNSPNGMFSDSGDFRGQLLTCWLKWACCPRLSAHLVAEYFQPGNYYVGSNRDHALFVRFNIEYVF